MKIVHIADTHIGYSAYNKLDPDTGINQREQDVYNAFGLCIARILDIKPDAVIHAGDLFDSVRPTNRAISVALDGLIRLSEAGIPTVLIAGNHETPRLRETGSVFRLFSHLKNIYPIYRARPETVELGDLGVYAVPHSSQDGAMADGLSKYHFPDDVRYRVMTVHAGVSGMKAFKTGSFNEQLVPSGCIPRQNVDYVALGHYHEECQVEDRAYYSGSTERLSFAEANHERKGFLQIDLDRADDPDFISIPTREMVDLPLLDCSSVSPDAINRTIMERVDSEDLSGKVARLRVLNIPRIVYKSLDFAKLRSRGKDAIHFEIRYHVLDIQGAQEAQAPQFRTLREEFEGFLAKEPVEGADKNDLEKLGLSYLERVQEEGK